MSDTANKMKNAASYALKYATDFTKTLRPNRPSLFNVVIFILVAAFLIYVFINIKKESTNCKRINKTPMNTSIVSMDSAGYVLDITKTTLNKTFIRTAYNCCCSGTFKNDYVSYCALINCAKQGVRALDFTIYSLKGKPVIGASTLVTNNYKETYNSLPFAETMSQVYKYFIASAMNCPNINDPLFLIFRVQSLLKSTYDEMSHVLNSTFGGASLFGNMIYYIKRDVDAPLQSVVLKELLKRVVIIIDITGVQKELYSKSKLSVMSALDVGNGENIIYRESDLIQQDAESMKKAENLSILYPDFSNTSNNYDFRSGLDQKINFIGLSFQETDAYLKEYNKLFATSAFIDVNSEKVANLIKGMPKPT
jgi:hypothetical protein